MKTYTHPEMEHVALPQVLAALADPCRMAIVVELLHAGEEPLACHEVPLEVSKATRSHHFEVLREAGLIRTRVEGNRCLSSLRKAELEARFPGLLRLVEANATEETVLHPAP